MDLVRKRYWFFLVSLIVIVPGIVFLLIPPALKPGIDFTSGSALTITFSRAITESELRSVMTDLGHPEAVIQTLGENAVFIRTAPLKEAEVDPEGKVIPAERVLIEDALQQKVATIVSREYDTVSAVVARETVTGAAIALAVASVAMLLYIAWAFRRVPNPFRYGTCAVVALVHDLLVVLGVFSILGKVMNMEVNAMFIVGILTVLGYSVNDAIVVFDRIRENISRAPERPLEETVNISLWETMGRSLNTGLPAMLALVAILLFGGATLQPLALCLLIGFVSGTYSTVFDASMLLVSWERGDFGKLLRRLRLLPARSR